MDRRWLVRGFALLSAVAAWGAGRAWAEPEPWLLGDDGDRVAVVAVRPGDEAARCAALLQECAGLDVPVQVFFLSGDAGDRETASRAAEAFGLSPDACDFLSGSADDLSALLAAFRPSHVVVTSADNGTLAALELAFPDPGRAPLVLLPVPPGDPDAALALTMPPYQLDARARAASFYSRAVPSGDTENYAALEIDDLADLPIAQGAGGFAESPEAPEIPDAPDPAENPEAPEAPEFAAEPPPAASAPAAAGPALRPRTRLPSQSKPKTKPEARSKAKPAPAPAPSAWGAAWDEPVRW